MAQTGSSSPPTAVQVEDAELFERIGLGVGAGRFRARLADRPGLVSLLLEPPGRPDRGRFAAWAQRMAGIDHPAVPTLVRIETAARPAYVAFDYVEGRSLADEIARRGEPLSPLHALAVTLQTAAGLDAAHRVGISHGALSPRSVVLVERPGAVDAVRIVGWSPPAELTLVDAGPPPESMVRQDVRALAVVLFTALTGAPPPSRPGDTTTAARDLFVSWIESRHDLRGAGELVVSLLSDEAAASSVTAFVAAVAPRFRALVDEACAGSRPGSSAAPELVAEVARYRELERGLMSKLRWVRAWLAENATAAQSASAQLESDAAETRRWRALETELALTLRAPLPAPESAPVSAGVRSRAAARVSAWSLWETVDARVEALQSAARAAADREATWRLGHGAVATPAEGTRREAPTQPLGSGVAGIPVAPFQPATPPIGPMVPPAGVVATTASTLESRVSVTAPLGSRAAVAAGLETTGAEAERRAAISTSGEPRTMPPTPGAAARPTLGTASRPDASGLLASLEAALADAQSEHPEDGDAEAPDPFADDGPTRVDHPRGAHAPSALRPLPSPRGVTTADSAAPGGGAELKLTEAQPRPVGVEAPTIGRQAAVGPAAPGSPSPGSAGVPIRLPTPSTSVGASSDRPVGSDGVVATTNEGSAHVGADSRAEARDGAPGDAPSAQSRAGAAESTSAPRPPPPPQRVPLDSLVGPAVDATPRGRTQTGGTAPLRLNSGIIPAGGPLALSKGSPSLPPAEGGVPAAPASRGEPTTQPMHRLPPREAVAQDESGPARGADTPERTAAVETSGDALPEPRAPEAAGPSAPEADESKAPSARAPSSPPGPALATSPPGLEAVETPATAGEVEPGPAPPTLRKGRATLVGLGLGVAGAAATASWLLTAPPAPLDGPGAAPREASAAPVVVAPTTASSGGALVAAAPPTSLAAVALEPTAPPAAPQVPAPDGMAYVPPGRVVRGLTTQQLEASMAQCRLDAGDRKPDPCVPSSFEGEALGEVVELQGFFIDKTEVDQARWDACRQKSKCPALEMRWDLPEQPASGVTRAQAEIFCKAIGGRLPTADEWLYAARGAEPRLYPWGEDPPMDASGQARANFGGKGGKRGSNGDDEHPYAAPVGTFASRGAGPFGVANMAGNAAEWTGTDARGGAIVVGGSWRDFPHELRTTRREVVEPTAQQNDMGFRCVRELSAGTRVAF